MWQFLPKPGARLLKDLQLVGLLYAISFAQSEGSWPSRPVQLCCRPKAKYLSNKTGAVRKHCYFWTKQIIVDPMWQFLSKPGARLLKDLQLVGLLCAISFAQSVLGSWTTQYVLGLYCSAVGRRQNTSPIKLELSENSTTCWSSGEVHHQSAFLSDSDIMRMLLTTISRRWCKKLPNWLSQCPS